MNLYETFLDHADRMPAELLVVDAGNDQLKAIRVHMTANGEVREDQHIMKHSFVELTASGWKKAMAESQRSSRKRAAGTQAFRFRIGRGKEAKWKSYKIGAGAQGHVDNRPLLGSAKYFEGGIDALLTALLLEIYPAKQFPKGHDNLIIAIGAPPTEYMHVDHLIGIINKPGGFRAETSDGRKAIFRPRVVIPFDEGVASMLTLQKRLLEGKLRNASGQYISNPLRKGDMILLLDAGGRIGNMGTVIFEGRGSFRIEYDTFRMIDGGMVTIRDQIRASLLATFAELRGATEANLRDDQMDRVLKLRQYQIAGGDPIDVDDLVNESLTYLSALRAVYTGHFGSGRAHQHICLTGGTTCTLYNEIVEELNHNSIMPVTPLSEIIFANAAGGVQIAVDSLREEGLLPQWMQATLEVLK